MAGSYRLCPSPCTTCRVDSTCASWICPSGRGYTLVIVKGVVPLGFAQPEANILSLLWTYALRVVWCAKFNFPSSGWNGWFSTCSWALARQHWLKPTSHSSTPLSLCYLGGLGAVAFIHLLCSAIAFGNFTPKHTKELLAPRVAHC